LLGTKQIIIIKVAHLKNVV